MKREFYFYTKDTNFARDEQGNIIPNPIPGPLRQRRQTIVGVIKEDGNMYFSKAETVWPDQFSRAAGKYAALQKCNTVGDYVLVTRIPTGVDNTPLDDKGIIRFFIKKAARLVTPGPILMREVVTKVVYRKISRRFLNANLNNAITRLTKNGSTVVENRDSVVTINDEK